MTWSPGCTYVTCDPTASTTPGRLVPEHRGHGMRVQALHEVEVGVAQAGGDGAHENLVRGRCSDLHVVDDEHAGDLFENRSFHDRGT